MKKTIMTLTLAGTLLAGGLSAVSTQANAADPDAKASSTVTAIVQSGGIEASATAVIDFGTITIGTPTSEKNLELNVVNKTGSAGWKVTVQQEVADSNVNVYLDGNIITASQSNYLSTTEVTSAPSTNVGKVKLDSKVDARQGNVNTTLQFVVSPNIV